MCIRDRWYQRRVHGGQRISYHCSRVNQYLILSMAAIKHLEFPFNLRSMSTNNDENMEDESARRKPAKEIFFLNYVPSRDTFRSKDRMQSKFSTTVQNIERGLREQVQTSIDSFLNEERGPLNIIPKRSNIDLKRHLAPKLEKLQKRTELALVELLSKYLLVRQSQPSLFLLKWRK
eukprot:TRINITY_DN1697_c0_g1_i2.p1 TRINITY_DN1697_c0_g1~~TRINITY_DN1697_c0_g1_i2.p1  ORF type:complete len:196 (-),score=39.36 TRINITY_DN1697_c0_g1_i2:401-928(-)